MSEKRRIIENLINEKLREERRIFMLNRSLPSLEEQNFHNLLLDKHLKANFENQLKDLSISKTDSNSFKQHSNTFDEQTTLEDFNLRNLWFDKLHVLLNPPIYNLDINVTPGSRVIGPPV